MRFESNKSKEDISKKDTLFDWLKENYLNGILILEEQMELSNLNPKMLSGITLPNDRKYITKFLKRSFCKSKHRPY